MCKVISVSNIKGGVAKTTSAANLGVGLVRKGKKVLLIDMDPQGSLSLGMGVRNNKELPYTVGTVIQKIVNDIEIESPHIASPERIISLRLKKLGGGPPTLAEWRW
ncbi:MAG: ParA family protein [Ruminococcus sp.]|nr:ParA family protein [Ruminococcus sp.]